MTKQTSCAVHVLALDGVLDSALAISRDVLAAANRIAVALGRAPPFETRLVALRAHVRTGTGLRIRAEGSARRGRPDVLVVLGMNVPSAAEIDRALARRDTRLALDVVRRAVAEGVRVLASCSGTFVCAEAGVLDGQPAVTSWWLGPLFRERYPRVRLEEGRMVVPGRVVTAGAALSQVDLMLWLVREVAGPTVADLAARYLVVDERPSQARYLLVDHLAHSNEEVARAEAYARKHLGRALGLRDLARAANTSPRTLERRFAEALGMSPTRYLRRLRAERAAHLLATTRRSLEDVAAAVGYADATTLWRLVRAELGVTPGALRS